MVTLKIMLAYRPKEDGTWPVVLRLTVARQTRLVNTGIFIPEKDWNLKNRLDKANWIKTSHHDHDTYNKQLKKLLSKTRKRLAQAQKNEATVTADTVKEMVNDIVLGKKKSSGRPTLSAFYRQHMTKFETQYTVHSYYRQALLRLTEFNQGQDLTFEQITPDFIRDFTTWLTTAYRSRRNGVKVGPTTANHYVDKLKTVMERALQKGYVSENIFQGYRKLKTNPRPVAALTAAEMELLEKADFKFDSPRWHARNLFLCQYYLIGSRTGDAQKLKFAHVDQMRISFQMQKTRKAQIIKLHQKLIELLEQYEYRRAENEYIFPYLESGIDYDAHPERLRADLKRSTAKINKLLQPLSRSLGIDKKVTTHVARHSFTGNAILALGDIFGVSNALGHGDTRTTEGYARTIKNQAVENLIDKFYPK